MSGPRNGKGPIAKTFRVRDNRAEGLGDAVFSSGQVAKICRVAPRTVSKWVDSGRLRGYRLPLSDDRRVPREELVRFMTEVGMPVPEELGEYTPPVRFPPVGLFLPRVVAGVASVGAVGAGVLAARGRLEVAVVGCTQGYATAQLVGTELRDALPSLRLALWLSEDRGAGGESSFSAVFPWDATPESVRAWAEGTP